MSVHLLNNSFVNLQPLSSFWTHKAIVSEAMVLTNTIDNESIQVENVRYHLNAALSHLTNLLNLATTPWYGVWFQFTPEGTLHPSGLEYSVLTDTFLGYNVAPLLHSIRRVNVQPESGAESNAWVGNCTKLDMAQLAQLATTQNQQWRHSIAWAHHGNEIIIFTGKGIVTTLHSERINNAGYTLLNTHFVGWGYRKPILDNLVPESVANGVWFNDEYRGTITQNYYDYIDLPDEYANLLIKIIQKNILEQLREQIPAQLEGEINQGLATITQNISAELQFEAAEREKRKYGAQQRGPGGVA